MKQRYFIAVFTLILIVLPISAQVEMQNLPLNGGKIVIDGKEFYLYKVQKSDGFDAITRKFGVSKAEVLEYNPELFAGLKLGQIIKLPIVQGRNSTSEELKESGKYIYHKVDSGQTLFYISRKYGVTEEDITSINPGTEQVLLYGTQLRIPILNVPDKPSMKEDGYLYHTIKPTETLFGISRKYGVTIKQIIAANPGIETSVLQLDEEIRIPRKTPSAKSALLPAVTETYPAATKDKEKSTWEDEKYFYHYVSKGENLFNITQSYNADMAQVLAANNLERNSGIQLGYYLKIPKSAIKQAPPEQKGKDFLVYKSIARRESLGLIASKFGVKQEDIRAINPNIDNWIKIKRGTLINIPIKAKFTTRKDIKLVDTVYAALNTDSMLLAEAFLVGCDTLGEDRPWNIAVLWPLFLEANDTINNVTEINELGDTIYRTRKQKIISYDVNGFREFYTGVLIAIDSLVDLGMRINLHTYDVDKDTMLIQKLIREGTLANMDLIIGPVYRDQINCVSSYCKENAIRMVAPYPTSAKSLESNPYMFQVSASQDVLYKPAVDFIVANYADYNIILVTSNEKSKRQEHFPSMLKRELYRTRMDQVEPIYFNELNFDDYSYGGFDKLISTEKENLIIIPSENLALFNKVSPNIENLINKRKITNITVFGFPEWQKLGGREREMLFRMNTVLYSPVHINFEDRLTKNLVKHFRKFIHGEPKAEGNTSGYISYGLLGYDVAFYFMSALNAFGSEFERCLPYLNVDLTTIDFNFVRTNNWSGFENRNIYFINYDRDFNIKLIDQY